MITFLDDNDHENGIIERENAATELLLYLSFMSGHNGIMTQCLYEGRWCR